MENGVPVSLNRNPISGFPDALGNVRITCRTGAATFAAIVKYVGPFYTDNFKNEDNKNDAYTVCNVEALYALPRVAGVELVLHGEVNNVFDRLYFASGEGNAFFPAAERNFVLGVTIHM